MAVNNPVPISPESIPASSIKPASVPAVAAEKTVKLGTSGGDRVINANLTGDGGTTLKYKIVHNLNTRMMAISYQKNEAGNPGEPMLSPAEKVVPINANEVELTFAAGKPLAAETIWVRIEA